MNRNLDNEDMQIDQPQPRSPLKHETEWHSRGYLPHWEAGEAPQSITFRLADSMPVQLRQAFRAELENLPPDQRTTAQARAIEAILDAGHGEALLAQPNLASIVEMALLHFDGDRNRLHAWCVMPNHVHVLATPLDSTSLSAIVHSWKSFTARRINRLLRRRGGLWFPEYFDRKIRNEPHYEAVRAYIEQNPVKAGLCSVAGAWRFSSAKRAEKT